MVGRQVNIYLQEKNYEAVRKLVGPRRISSFIDRTLEEKLNHERQKNQEEFQQKLTRGYQAMSKNRKLKEELSIWEETLEDVWRK